MEEAPEGKERLEGILRSIANHEAIANLRVQQNAIDRIGPLDSNEKDLNLSLAMTLRDCTCFARIPRRPQDGRLPKVRLADFDWKNTEGKFGAWQSTERTLIDGGFYTADWLLCNGTLYHPPTLCALEWTPRNSDTHSPDAIVIESKRNTRGSINRADANTISGRAVHCEGDAKAVALALVDYRKEKEGTPRDELRNPHRSNPT